MESRENCPIGNLALAAACAALIVCGLAFAPLAEAQRGRVQDDFLKNAPEEEEVKEIAAPTLPPYPVDSNWIEFEPNGRATNRFFIDGASLTVGADKVIRFSLLILTPTKVRNISYSGLRCKTEEWKDYAFGSPEGVWRISESARWRQITEIRLNNYQHTLARDFFCFPGVMTGGPVGNEKVLLRNLKNPRPADGGLPRRY